ncbi:type II toxin-antitoxin system HigB family toxin [Cognatiyoonia sp. IB215182]|uniref:type II toxin-antitoxin system HigB family toxin n=1 Tax=Cognatiyoonia sp. IB215182 TaxID=3097353 RepID=UPI002A10B390|nr:type II toxin-antitoxin system HigB family toxin [Cognatiyoonia sp. IB215182]MDX8355292.1 type II toxin-antitoxin system HigB family toxin [Cognatiyoonia sp. IB215182]
MRIIAKRTITEFGAKNPNARASLDHWLNIAQAADWASTNDVQLTFPKAKVLNAERVRFEVAGGDFRMICAFEFRRRITFVKFIGTHKEYDRVDVMTVSQY